MVAMSVSVLMSNPLDLTVTDAAGVGVRTIFRELAEYRVLSGIGQIIIGVDTYVPPLRIPYRNSFFPPDPAVHNPVVPHDFNNSGFHLPNHPVSTRMNARIPRYMLPPMKV